MKDAVAARGQRVYGQNFNMDHAKKLFRDINNERLQQGHQQQSQYVANKQNMQSNAPPQQHAEGATSSIESIQNQIRDPKNKNMDLRSDGFQETVKRFLNAGDNAVNSMLGGNKR
jgi:type II secretory pathway component PulC